MLAEEILSSPQSCWTARNPTAHAAIGVKEVERFSVFSQMVLGLYGRFGGVAERLKASHLGAICGQPHRRFESFPPPPYSVRAARERLSQAVSRLAHDASLTWSAPDIVPIRTQHGKAVGRLYSACGFVFLGRSSTCRRLRQHSNPGATSSAAPSAGQRSIATS
jgi:hypothetical protein